MCFITKKCFWSIQSIHLQVVGFVRFGEFFHFSIFSPEIKLDRIRGLIWGGVNINYNGKYRHIHPRCVKHDETWNIKMKQDGTWWSLTDVLSVFCGSLTKYYFLVDLHFFYLIVPVRKWNLMMPELISIQFYNYISPSPYTQNNSLT